MKYLKIKNHVFTPGCEDEKCRWCNFVTRNMPVITDPDIEAEDETLILSEND